MKTKATLAALAVLFLISCNGGKEKQKDKEETQTVKIGGRYLIELPTSLSETTGLNDDASLQYQNILQELYAVVIDESKATLQKTLDENEMADIYPNNLEGYMKLVTLNFEEGLHLDSIPEAKDAKIDGLPAKVMSFEATVDGLPKIYYKMAFIEGKSRYYQVMAWTLANRKTKHEAAMQDIINSFKESGKSKN